VSDRHDLRQALDAARGRHLVLIDTVGMGQRDTRVSEQSLLLAQPGVSRLLLLNAAAQAETLDEVVAAYGDRAAGGEASSLAGAIVTKIDEAAKTAPVLDVAIRHRLSLHYIANGQRVPEDLYAPNAVYLADRSLRLGSRPTPYTLGDDEFALATASVAAAHA
jgi:flagellar biosynthesis protein FlhF